MIDVLGQVDLIVAEDTRRTQKLLNHYNIRTPTLSYHKFNERERTEQIMDRINQGMNIALVSDSGTPAISDPGQTIISACIEAGIKVEMAPGVDSVIPALVLSGFDTSSFYFYGFAPRRKVDIKRWALKLKDETSTAIVFESPMRIVKLLAMLVNVFPKRNIALMRELTKVHEEVIRGSIEEVLERISSQEIRGEVVLVIAGAQEKREGEMTRNDDIMANLKEAGLELKKFGFSAREIAKILVWRYDISRNLAYKISISVLEKNR
ncbi:MAG: 16S rRNA (cytidine(1402)-2'-O)-methyltransferase [Actinobacteria bacterium]|nr:16S rRNA (cytidine(1402)-2'-O)-methyltransferase [Actinomycetota bacterium]